MKMKITTIGILLFALLAISVNAFPYQLNLTTGILTDLNASNNMTTTLTINVINYTYVNYTYYYGNITWMNITNVTCNNCSLNYTTINVTNINLTNNGYNSSDLNASYVTIENFNAYKSSLTYPYASVGEFQALTGRVNGIETSSTANAARVDTLEKNKDDHLSMWITMIASLIFSFVGIFLAWRAGGFDDI